LKIMQNMTALLEDARRNGYAVGSFSSRFTAMVQPIILGAIETDSPVIIQESQIEVKRHLLPLRTLADEVKRQIEILDPQVPIVLHLDHTKDIEVVREAINCGFTSVMIDASAKSFDENVELAKRVIEMAHPKGVTVEAELGKIGTTDFAETDYDIQQFTDPEEARKFVELTGVDALAVSVGTAHGAYSDIRRPRVDLKRIAEINALIRTPLVLHGGSGTPSQMVTAAVKMASGGVCKVNIATDLETAQLAIIGKSGHMTEPDWNKYDEETKRKGAEAVKACVEDKIRNYVLSAGHAAAFR
jgi:ketose-bisphosphate aldolase